MVEKDKQRQKEAEQKYKSMTPEEKVQFAFDQQIKMKIQNEIPFTPEEEERIRKQNRVGKELAKLPERHRPQTKPKSNPPIAKPEDS